MPAENTTHWLTPSGWLECTDVPSDAVERWERAAEHCDGKLHVDYKRVWADPIWPVAELKEVRESFALPEAGVSARIAEISWEIPD
jgi:hypothetical protein